jgi:hypothetical protein
MIPSSAAEPSFRRLSLGIVFYALFPQVPAIDFATANAAARNYGRRIDRPLSKRRQLEFIVFRF